MVTGPNLDAENRRRQHEAIDNLSDLAVPSAFVEDETLSTYQFLMAVLKYAVVPFVFIFTVAVCTVAGILIVRAIP